MELPITRTMLKGTRKTATTTSETGAQTDVEVIDSKVVAVVLEVEVVEVASAEAAVTTSSPT
jgi:hypothetical protein